MNRMLHLFLPLLLLLSLSSCVKEDEYADTPEGNFEALWHIIDEHYCFFDYKEKEYGLDWNEVYLRYKPQFDAGMSNRQKFEVLTNMLGELRDGHVNLYTSFDMGRYWSWFEAYPSNLSDTLLNKYLGRDYQISNGLRYRVLDDHIGYVRCPSFSNELGEGNLDQILYYLAPCRGLIIDLRDNGGGLLTSAEQLAARFTNEECLVGYMQHKTGRGHNDFSPMEAQYVKPSKALRWQKPVCILTNRQVFSAANEFVKYMKCFPNVTVVGDRTGGGAGLPFSSELPCGWSIRFSACPMYDRNRQSTEFGIEPDVRVDLSQDDLLRGIDTIIETARRQIN
ncbi:MAG: S41 family peptidase [Prevotella sp.]|nr:S41 family peptidase [Prevotella sp.]